MPDQGKRARFLSLLFAAINQGRHNRLEVTIRDGEHKVKFELPPDDGAKADTPAVTPEPDVKLNEMETDILRAATSPLTGEQLSRETEYPFDGGFRQALASLRRQGYLFNHNPGYQTTPLGTQVLTRQMSDTCPDTCPDTNPDSHPDRQI
jgi:hypothetical protein